MLFCATLRKASLSLDVEAVESKLPAGDALPLGGCRIGGALCGREASGWTAGPPLAAERLLC